MDFGLALVFSISFLFFLFLSFFCFFLFLSPSLLFFTFSFFLSGERARLIMIWGCERFPFRCMPTKKKNDAQCENIYDRIIGVGIFVF